MTKIKSKITPDTILKNFWKNNNRFADLFNACFFDGNPKLNPDDLTEVDTDISSLLQFHGYAETVKKIVDVVKKSAYGVDFVILGIEIKQRSTMQCHFDICLEMLFHISKNTMKFQKNIKMKNLMEHRTNFYLR